ncbi:efflux RND transporter periplasmic adaptor subunit [Planctomycetota bacterium]
MLRTSMVIVLVLVCISVLGIGVRKLVGEGGNQQAFVFYKAKKADLPIVVTERGSLESQVETTITCRVENVGDRSSNGTQIIFIVPNGSAVEQDQLVVEFDSATIRDRLDQQTLDYQKATSARIQAVAKYDNQAIQNITSLREAELAIKLAEIELLMYTDERDGTEVLALEQIARQVDEAKNTALEARAQLELAEVERAGMKELFKLGYRGKSDLEQSRLKYLQAEDRLASSINKVKTFDGTRRNLERFERKMEVMRIEGAKDTAKRNLKQVVNDNESLLQQALAAKEEAVNAEIKEKERLDHMAAQLGNCKILAPHSGMVVYKQERRGGSEIEEGALVRERQDILTLPNLTRMQVNTQVHEAVLDQVRPGLPASIRIDAFPDRVYRGVVEKVGVVPASSGGWMSSGSAKTYETTVKLIDEVVSLKPGMTAVVNMHVDKIENVITVPVQAIIQANGDTWCYVESKDGKGVERREIEIGRSNDRFVHVKKGISEGDRIVLNSMDIYDQENQEPDEISAESGVPEMPDSLDGVGFDAPASGGPGGSKSQGPGGRRPGEGATQGSKAGDRSAFPPAGGQRGGRGPGGPRGQGGGGGAGGRPGGGGQRPSAN